MQTRQATVTRKGQVTIPVDIRRALGLAAGGPVEFAYQDDGAVTLRAARKLTLTQLLAGFDPERHRHSAADRVWDDEPRGAETL
jgi:AbrB family looped-hinge helix DNA binding protein